MDPNNELREELFYPNHKEKQQTHRMSVDLEVEVSTSRFIALRDQTKAISSYLTRTSGEPSWTKKSQTDKKQCIGRKSTTYDVGFTFSSTTTQLQSFG